MSIKSLSAGCWGNEIFYYTCAAPAPVEQPNAGPAGWRLVVSDGRETSETIGSTGWGCNDPVDAGTGTELRPGLAHRLRLVCPKTVLRISQ